MVVVRSSLTQPCPIKVRFFNSFFGGCTIILFGHKIIKWLTKYVQYNNVGVGVGVGVVLVLVLVLVLAVIVYCIKRPTNFNFRPNPPDQGTRPTSECIIVVQNTWRTHLIKVKLVQNAVFDNANQFSA